MEQQAVANISALWSSEVEYQGVIVAMCEAIWLKRLLQDLWVEVVDSIPIYCDNINRMPLVKKPVFHARTKHKEVHYHFVRERILSGVVKL